MRCRSAITRGRSAGRSISTVCLPPPLRNVFLATSTRAATSDGSGVTDRRTCFDAARIQQVTDQAIHVIRLLVDDAKKLAFCRSA